MKELYVQQLQELSTQTVAHFGFGYALTFPLMGPIVRSATHGWMLRFPVALSFATTLAV